MENYFRLGNAWRSVACLLPTAGLLVSCASAGPENAATLKAAFKNDFLIGAALNENQFTERDAVGAKIVSEQFNSITPENILKWESVHPEPDKYNFAPGDGYVAFGEKHHMWIIGHTLVWHNQTPNWVFEDDNGKPVDREILLKRLHDHIQTVVGRYKGRIKGWDVVNEALNEDGTMRQTRWLKIIGDDYIVKAFQYAHEADPNAQLHYNDYSLENEPKRRGAIELIKKLKAAGVPITAVGLQGHDKMDWPTTQQEDETIADFAKLGVAVMITELDVDVLPSPSRNQTADITLRLEQQSKTNPYTNGLPDEVQQQLAKRYADLFRVFVKHRDVVKRVTFWGVCDGDSWLNGWPVRGRTSYPLLFDREGNPKPAFQAVIETAK
ncbi:MAG TPA: endo-1,4-beta-xylanase [Verrucomicrobiae bacterium]|nr:endo-1,4-beta-xylanase [Verrucomicrobiae bacterium]